MARIIAFAASARARSGDATLTTPLSSMSILVPVSAVSFLIISTGADQVTNFSRVDFNRQDARRSAVGRVAC